MKRFPLLTLLFFSLLIGTSANSQSVKHYTGKESHFKTPPVLESNNYPTSDIYIVYKKGSNSLSSLRNMELIAQTKMAQFANEKGKSYVILGQRVSSPPYVLGNYPKVEIIFALVDKTNTATKDPVPTTKDDKLTRLERLKKLLDDGTLTKEEYEKEKKKILEEN